MARLSVHHVPGTTYRRSGEFLLAVDVKVSAYRNAPLTVSLSTNGIADDEAAYVVTKSSRILARLDSLLLGNTLVEGRTPSGDASGVKLAIIAADPLAAVLGRRRRQNESVYGRAAGDTRTWTTTEQTTILKNIVDDENTRYDTWLRTSDIAIPATGVSRTLTLEQGKPVVEACLDMANAFDGFDLNAIPVYEAGSAVMADLGVWQRRGTQRSEIVFEYDPNNVASNIASFTAPEDGTRVTTHQSVTGASAARVQVITPDAPFGGQIYDSEDAFSDVTDETLLTTIANQLLAWRSRPKDELTITPAATADLLPVRDFDIGDEIKVKINSPVYAVDGFVRVYGWTLGRSETGEARLEQIMISPSDQGNG